jgi:transposase-like protein
MSKHTSNKFSPEVRTRAVRLVLDHGAFDRLGRYNAALWKQTAQTLFLLQTIRRPQL